MTSENIAIGQSPEGFQHRAPAAAIAAASLALLAMYNDFSLALNNAEAGYPVQGGYFSFNEVFDRTRQLFNELCGAVMCAMPAGRKVTATGEKWGGRDPDRWVEADPETGIWYMRSPSDRSQYRGPELLYPRSPELGPIAALDMAVAIPHLALVARQLIDLQPGDSVSTEVVYAELLDKTHALPFAP